MNQNISDEILDQLTLRQINRIAERRVEIAFSRVPGNDPFGLERLGAENLQRDLKFARFQIRLGFGVTAFENALLANDALFPGKTVGEVLTTMTDVIVSEATPSASDLSPAIVRQGFLQLKRVAGRRIPF